MSTISYRLASISDFKASLKRSDCGDDLCTIVPGLTVLRFGRQSAVNKSARDTNILHFSDGKSFQPAVINKRGLLGNILTAKEPKHLDTVTARNPSADFC